MCPSLSGAFLSGRHVGQHVGVGVVGERTHPVVPAHVLHKWDKFSIKFPISTIVRQGPSTVSQPTMINKPEVRYDHSFCNLLG